jgi:hypothetical protein
MALRLAQKPPKKRPQQRPPEPKKVEKTEKKLREVTDEELDTEYKYDPQIGSLVPVDRERQHNRYPSCDCLAKVARCVYCEKVKDKTHMRCLGQNYHEKGSLKYVWSCKNCNAFVSAWKTVSKKYTFDARLQRLWNYDLTTNKQIRHKEEEELAVGKQIVEKRKERIDAELVKALSKHKKSLVDKSRKIFVEKFAKKKEEHRVDLHRGVVAEKPKTKGGRVEKETDGEELRSANARAGKLPRWKRKGRSAKVRRG